MSKPISAKVSYLMYIDDLKVFASSEAKLNRVLKSTSAAMEDIGLTWNPNKCNVIYVRKGAQVHDAAGVRLRHDGVVESLRAIEQEYKLTKIKSAIKLYENTDPTMRLVQKFEERASEKGFTSLVKEACKYAEELDTGLTLNYPNPSCSPRQAPDTEILGKKVKGYLRRTVTEKLQEEIESEQWHGRFL